VNNVKTVFIFERWKKPAGITEPVRRPGFANIVVLQNYGAYTTIKHPGVVYILVTAPVGTAETLAVVMAEEVAAVVVDAEAVAAVTNLPDKVIIELQPL
jgi:hypothetical protein